MAHDPNTPHPYAGSGLDLLDKQRLIDLLTRANDLLRSAKSIAERQGNATNWEAWNARLDVVLLEQHQVMYPERYSASLPYLATPDYPPNPDLPGPQISPPTRTVVPCPVCWHRATGPCDGCGGVTGTPILDPCPSCPNGVPIG